MPALVLGEGLVSAGKNAEAKAERASVMFSSLGRGICPPMTTPPRMENDVSSVVTALSQSLSQPTLPYLAKLDEHFVDYNRSWLNCALLFSSSSLPSQHCMGFERWRGSVPAFDHLDHAQLRDHCEQQIQLVGSSRPNHGDHGAALIEREVSIYRMVQQSTHAWGITLFPSSPSPWLWLFFQNVSPKRLSAS